MSPKFSRKLPELVNVPNRTAIRMHSGNSIKDTQGCILVGISDKAGWLRNGGEKNKTEEVVGISDKAGWLRNSVKYEQKIVELIKEYHTCWIAVA